MKTRLGVGPVAFMLFVSGACALVYQTAWFRELRLVFGGSTAASAAVTAIFMAGLGLGNALLGKLAERSPLPLVWYARLEAGVALGAALSPALVDLVEWLYRALGGQEALGSAGATAVRLVLAALVLGFPAFLMGGTLPAAAIAVSRADDPSRRGAAVLYALNTFGAVAGALLTTFVLLEHLGVRATIWAACGVNLLVAVAAYYAAPAVAAGTAFAAPAPVVSQRTKKLKKREQRERESEPDAEPAEAPIAPDQRFWVYATAGIAGFSFMLMELVWFRMLAPVLGGSTFTFGLILAVALLGIGLGGLLYPLIYARRTPTLAALAFSCAAEALCVIAPFAAGDAVPIIAAELFDEYRHGFARAAWDWFLMASVVVIPAAIVSGVQFPLFIALLGRAEQNVGEHIGRAYAWNTLGAILGSLAGGFGLLPLLSATGAWKLTAGLLLLTSLLLLSRAVASSRSASGLFSPLAVAATAALLMFAPGPSAVWRHTGIGAGRDDMPSRETPNGFRRWINNQRGYVLWETDGVEASLAITAANGLAFVVNGKVDGNAVSDSGTQVMCGLLGALLHPEPKSALVVGLGTGQTAGWLAAVDSMQRVDVVEIEPAVDEMARRTAAANFNVLEHPKVNRIYNDAREVIAVSPRTYDVISSEPSNPYRAGISSLFTREFYRDVKSRLNPGGLFVQFLQGYEIDRRTFRTVLMTLRAEFAHVEVWQSHNYDVEFVCSNEPPRYSVASLRANLSREPYKTALPMVWRATTVEGILSRYVAGPKTVDLECAGKFIEAAPEPDKTPADVVPLDKELGRVNTDDFNVIEYGFVRTLGRPTDFAIEDICEAARTIDDDHPSLTDAPIDWNAVNDERRGMRIIESRGAVDKSKYLGDQAARADALRAALKNNFKQAATLWESQPRAPTYSFELALIGLAYAELGDAKALPIIEQLRASNATEADLLLGVLHWTAGRRPESIAALSSGFLRLRGLPFVNALICTRALRVACLATQQNPDAAKTLLPALEQPFVVGTDDRARRWAGCIIASNISPAAAVPWFEPLEPHPLWTQPALGLRKAAYENTGHPLAAKAAADFDEFQRNGDQRRSRGHDAREWEPITEAN